VSNAPSTDNYQLGKGILYFDRFDSDGNGTGELDLGNAPAFNIGITLDTLDHFESRSGIREKDLSVNVSVSSLATFTLDEYSKENIALAILGAEPSTETQGSGSVTDEAVTARHDRWVKLLYRNIKSVVVNDDGGGGVYVIGVDYEVDQSVGRLKILSTGSIADAAALDVDYVYTSETWNTMLGVSVTAIEGLLRFVGDPDQGIAYEAEIWKVKLRPTSPLGFISDDWGTIEFEAEIQKDVANHPTNPWFKIREEGTAGGGS